MTDNELEQELELLTRDISLDENLNTYPNTTADYLIRSVTCMRELMKRMHDMQQHYHNNWQYGPTESVVFGFKRYGAKD